MKVTMLTLFFFCIASFQSALAGEKADVLFTTYFFNTSDVIRIFGVAEAVNVRPTPEVQEAIRDGRVRSVKVVVIGSAKTKTVWQYEFFDAGKKDKILGVSPANDKYSGWQMNSLKNLGNEARAKLQSRDPKAREAFFRMADIAKDLNGQSPLELSDLRDRIAAEIKDIARKASKEEEEKYYYYYDYTNPNNPNGFYARPVGE